MSETAEMVITPPIPAARDIYELFDKLAERPTTVFWPMSQSAGRALGKHSVAFRKLFPAPRRHSRAVHRAYAKMRRTPVGILSDSVLNAPRYNIVGKMRFPVVRWTAKK